MTKPRLATLPSSASTASEPRWTQMPCFLRRLAARGEHRVFLLAAQIWPPPARIAIEQARHFRREQHRRAARGRLADRVHQRRGVGLGVDAGVRLEQRDPVMRASNSSSLPSRSSATSSLQPPTCRPSMKICGTVVRPSARWIISCFASPPKSTEISRYSTPLAVEQMLGPPAISAKGLGVDFDTVTVGPSSIHI